jgi:hypothetical protein
MLKLLVISIMVLSVVVLVLMGFLVAIRLEDLTSEEELALHLLG